ncbi:phage tail tape measure protein [Aeromonas veronii]
MANKKLSATITIGGAVASSLKSAFGSVKGGVNEVGSALRAAEKQQRLLTKAINREGWSGIGNLDKKLKAATERVDKLRASFKRLRDVQSRQNANLEARSEYRGQIFDAVALGATVSAPVVMAANFETAMLGVAKQVDGARDSSGKLTSVYYEMGKQIQQLGREIPLTTNEIADMVTAGSRMGVARDQLIDFTRTSAMMADAFELPAGELADNMGKIAGLFKIPIPAIGELADSINYLDDNAISKGGDIIEFLTRTGGVASAVKVTGQEMAALGSTMLTLGERTETAGTAANAMFQKFAAADKGTKNFKSALKELGISSAAVQKGMQQDATGTMMKVLEAIGKLPKEKQLGVMVELVGLEHSDTLVKLANNTEEWRRQLALANSEAAKGSMSREFAARLQTTTAQWILMKNAVSEVAVNIGSVLLPAINDMFKAVEPVVGAMADFARDNPEITKAIVGTAAALVALNVSTKAAGYGFTFLKGGALQVAGVFAKGAARAAMMNMTLRQLAAAPFKHVAGGLLSIGQSSLTMGKTMAKHPFGKKKWLATFNDFKFSSITAGFKRVAASMLMFGGSVKRLPIRALGSIKTGLGSAATSLLGFGASIKKNPIGLLKNGLSALVKFPFSVVSGGLGMVGGAIRGVALALISNPIGLILAGIAVAGYAIYKNWDSIKAFSGGVFSTIGKNLEPVQKAFARLGSALGLDGLFAGIEKLWGWFKKLFDPVEKTKAELDDARKAGEDFGVVLGNAIASLETPINWLAGRIEWITSTMSSLGSTVSTWGKNTWEGAKSIFSFSGDEKEEQPAANDPLPRPALATGRGGVRAGPYYDQSQITIQIAQRKGESDQAFAKRLAAELEAQRGVRQRSMMTEGMIPQ